MYHTRCEKQMKKHLLRKVFFGVFKKIIYQSILL